MAIEESGRRRRGTKGIERVRVLDGGGGGGGGGEPKMAAEVVAEEELGGGAHQGMARIFPLRVANGNGIYCE